MAEAAKSCSASIEHCCCRRFSIAEEDEADDDVVEAEAGGVSGGVSFPEEVEPESS